MHEGGDANQAGIGFKAEAFHENFERHLVAGVGERRAVEIEADRTLRTVPDIRQPQEPGMRIDEAPDQPSASQPVGPGPVTSGPRFSLVSPGIRAFDPLFHRVRLLRGQNARYCRRDVLDCAPGLVSRFSRKKILAENGFEFLLQPRERR